MHDPRVIANAVLSRASRLGHPLTNLDLQKIVYLLHGFFLRQTGRPLVTGEFVAWDYGPVHRALYDALKVHGDAFVDTPARKYNPFTRQHVDLPLLDDPEAEALLDSNLAALLAIPTFELVQLTHAPGTPWSRTMDAAEKRVNIGMVIENDLIATHFEGDAVTRRAGGGRTRKAMETEWHRVAKGAAKRGHAAA